MNDATAGAGSAVETVGVARARLKLLRATVIAEYAEKAGEGRLAIDAAEKAIVSAKADKQASREALSSILADKAGALKAIAAEIAALAVEPGE